MKKLLVAIPFNLFPVDHGGKLDIINSLKQIKEANVNLLIDLMYCANEEILDNGRLQLLNELGIRQIYFIKKETNFLKLWINFLFSGAPLYVVNYHGFSNCKLHDQYDFVLIHGFFADNILNHSQLKHAKFYYRMHNYEYKYYFNKIRYLKNPIIKALKYIEAYKIKYREKWLLNHVDKILFISSSEYKLFYNLYPTKSVLMPTYYPGKFLTLYKPKVDAKVLFIGNLFTSYNVNGLKWYLTTIHGLVLKLIPDYELIIVGSSAGLDINYFINYVAQYRSVKIFIDEQDLNKFYNQAKVFINVMLDGAGVKIKTLDAIYHGLPLVTTSVGVDGLAFENDRDCLVCDEAIAFANNIINLLNNQCLCEKLVQNSQKVFSQLYCNTSIINNLYS